MGEREFKFNEQAAEPSVLNRFQFFDRIVNVDDDRAPAYGVVVDSSQVEDPRFTGR
jgi:hypothetical protein